MSESDSKKHMQYATVFFWIAFGFAITGIGIPIAIFFFVFAVVAYILAKVSD